MRNIVILCMLILSNLLAETGLTQNHLVSVSPSSSQIDVAIDTQIKLTFNAKIHSLKDIVLVHNDNAVQGTTTLSTDSKSLIFTPSEILTQGEYQVGVEALELEGAKENPCSGFWNKLKVFNCKYLNLSCSSICYEDETIQTQAIKYNFSVDDSIVRLTSLEFTDAHEVSEKHMQLNTTHTLALVGRYSDDTNKAFTLPVEYIFIDSTQDIISIQNNTITAHSVGITQIKAVYNNVETPPFTIVVYTLTNGYRLPPEPDEDINNATLLGVDSNYNGVRDDVEIWIVTEMEIIGEHPKVERAIAMQYAKATQKILAEDGISNAMNVTKIMDRAGDCRRYYFQIINVDFPIRIQYYANNKILRDVIYNTKNRVIQNKKYNYALSGNIFTLQEPKNTDCDENLTKLGAN